VVPQSHGKFEFCDGNIEISGNPREGGLSVLDPWTKIYESGIDGSLRISGSISSGMFADAREGNLE